MTADPEQLRRAALIQLDHSIAALRGELTLVTADDYAAMQPHEQRLIDAARRSIEAYDREVDSRR